MLLAPLRSVQFSSVQRSVHSHLSGGIYAFRSAKRGMFGLDFIGYDAFLPFSIIMFKVQLDIIAKHNARVHLVSTLPGVFFLALMWGI